MSGPQDARILILDDQEPNLRVLDALLRRVGYSNLHCLADSTKAIETIVRYAPDLVLLDLHMPDPDGYAVLEQMTAVVPPGEYLPVLVLTADITREAKERALALGAKDFLAKPLDSTEVILRIRNLLETRLLQLELAAHARTLEQRVRDRTAELESARLEILERLAVASDFRDDATGKHARRVGEMAAQLAAELGVPGDTVELYRWAAPLHDVGKLGVPDSVLLKPGKLTPEEFDLMKRHTEVGASILSGSSAPVLQLAEQIALTHHERWDGGGYMGLKGEEIPLCGRIVAVADVYDALTHERPYKHAWTLGESLAEIRSLSGKAFDPSVAEAFLALAAEGRIAGK